MRTLFKFVIMSVAMVVALPVQAATLLTFNFSNVSGSNWGVTGPASSLAANAYDGNGRIFTATSGTETVRVRASAWSIDSANLVQDSFLGGYSSPAYPGGGLGVTSGDDARGANNRHTVDNETRKDFILLQFDQAVQLSSARFNAYAVNGRSYTDTDATIGYGTTANAWNAQPSLNNQNISALNTIIPLANRYSNNNTGAAGASGSQTRAINPNSFIGNVWLVSASLANNYGGDNKIDGFKFNALQVFTVDVIPEPSSWAMMIAGFGLVGGAMRKRRSAQAVIA